MQLLADGNAVLQLPARMPRTWWHLELWHLCVGKGGGKGRQGNMCYVGGTTVGALTCTILSQESCPERLPSTCLELMLLGGVVTLVKAP